MESERNWRGERREERVQRRKMGEETQGPKKKKRYPLKSQNAFVLGLPGGSVVKNLPANAGDERDMGLIPESGRFLEEENGNPSSILARKIIWTQEPCRLQTMVHRESDTTEHIIYYISVKVKSESEVAHPPCPTRRDPMDCSLPGSSIHGSFQARVLEWVATAFSGLLTLVLYRSSDLVMLCKHAVSLPFSSFTLLSLLH